VSNSSLAATVDMVKNSSNNLVDLVNNTACNAVFVVTELKFSGSGALNDILRQFEPFIKQYIQDEIGQEICVELKELTEHNLTTLIQQENEHIIPWLNPQPDTPPVDQGLLI
jgi:hypothetical protein